MRRLIPDSETLREIEKAAWLQCTKKEAAKFLEVHPNTLSRFFNNCDLAQQAWDRGRARGVINILRNSKSVSSWIEKNVPILKNSRRRG